MKKIVSILIGVLSPALGVVGTKFYFDRRTRREAAETQPKIQALLDEMIRLVASRDIPLDRLVGMNSLKTVNDEKRDRYLTLHAGDTSYSLDVSTRLTGRKAGRVCVGIHRTRGDAVLHLHWPAIVEYWPMEPWLQERLARLDALVGETSRLRGIKRRFPFLDDDDKGTPNSN